MKNVKKILSMLNFVDRKQAILLLIMLFLSALLDTLGVASILPFVSVLSNPEIVQTNIILNKMFEISMIFGVRSNQSFLFALGILVLVLLIISIIVKSITLLLEVRFVQFQEYKIAKRLIEGYLSQPYSWFLNRNTADFGKTILSEVNQIVGGGLTSLVSLIAKSLLTIALLILLLLTNPKLTLIVGFALSLSYGIIFLLVRKNLKRIGNVRLKNNQLRYNAVIETFSAIKEIKFAGLERTFVDSFAIPAKIYATKHATAAMINQLPRFLLELIAFGGIMLILIYLIGKKGSFIEIIPLISLYALATYRLLPAVQQIYSSISLITFVGPSVDNLHNEIKIINSLETITNTDNISFKNKISIKNMNFNYPDTSRTALNDINIEIKAKTTVGIIGATGSGKTTIIDIILGLLEPKTGSIEIDDIVVTKKNKRSWQKMIGYVPQQVYLADDTITANIAFGYKSEDINQSNVKKASIIANLHDFVVNDLPDKYNTKIGERGVRLSGGQRQRIGIARALYHNPQVLILDEATNALDNQTEKAVMDAINNLRKDMTIIIIAHRINTIKNCDKIFLVEGGKIKDIKNFVDFPIDEYNYLKSNK